MFFSADRWQELYIVLIANQYQMRYFEPKYKLIFKKDPFGAIFISNDFLWVLACPHYLCR